MVRRHPVDVALRAGDEFEEVLRWRQIAGLDELRSIHMPATLASARVHLPGLAVAYPELPPALA